MPKRTPFGKYIRDKRVLAELTLKEVAKALGISSVYLGEIERGVKPPLRGKYWIKLIETIPTITLLGLEQTSLISVPLVLPFPPGALEDAKYRAFLLAFHKRIEDKGLSVREIHKIQKILGMDH